MYLSLDGEIYAVAILKCSHSPLHAPCHWRLPCSTSPRPAPQEFGFSRERRASPCKCLTSRRRGLQASAATSRRHPRQPGDAPQVSVLRANEFVASRTPDARFPPFAMQQRTRSSKRAWREQLRTAPPQSTMKPDPTPPRCCARQGPCPRCWTSSLRETYHVSRKVPWGRMGVCIVLIVR